MALSPGDPHSYSRPELARVTDITLGLNVDFDRRVLSGIAVLSIKRLALSNEVILDSYGLVILRVTNFSTGSDLNYEIGDRGIFGSKFTIQLPQIVEDNNDPCVISIEYDTSPNSPALYWLRPEQTAGGTHPFLLSNNKYTYARAVFPCQDTPSVKFTYSADILAPPDFTVLMSAKLESVSNKYLPLYLLHSFSQLIPVPSYSVIIAVGVLKQYNLPNSRFDVVVWFDNYSQIADKVFSYLLRKTKLFLKTAKDICGEANPCDLLNICVLPPSVSHFEIECPCLMFVSPTLIDGDWSLTIPIAQNISQNWTGILVTCANFEHLWLNKCFSMYICKRILQFLLLKDDEREFFRVKDLDNATDKNCLLLPNLIGLLPHDNTKHVLYESGYLFLIELQNVLGGASVFEAFLKSYLTNFAYKSIKTEDWMTYLYYYFPNKFHILESIDWSSWLYVPKISLERTFETLPVGISIVNSEETCLSLAKRWINWNGTDRCSFRSTDIECFFDLQRIYFLNYLCASRKILGAEKMSTMASIYRFNNQNDEIRYVWLRLCIRNRLIKVIPDALNFAIKFSSPRFTYIIFRDLYEWTDARNLAIETFSQDGWKMLEEIKENVASILCVRNYVRE